MINKQMDEKRAELIRRSAMLFNGFSYEIDCYRCVKILDIRGNDIVKLKTGVAVCKDCYKYLKEKGCNV